MSEAQNQPEPRNVSTLLQAFKSGDASPRSISVEERLACVEHMSAEGRSALEIAHLFEVSDRTIYRDREEIRKRGRHRFDPDHGAILVGEYDAECSRSIARFRRIANDAQATPSERIRAEREAIKTLNGRIKFFQSMGRLPVAKAHPSEVPQATVELAKQLTNLLDNQDAIKNAKLVHMAKRISAELAELEQDNPEGLLADASQAGDDAA